MYQESSPSTAARLDEVSAVLIDSILQVHRALGPGLLESAYEACLTHELRKRGLTVRCGVPIPVHYDGLELDVGYRIDMLVESPIIIENKAVRSLDAVHQAQLLTYLKLSGVRLGFLVNWNVALIKDGIRRVVCGF
ncbi:MAG: GxxExxY protein [Gemmatimonadota bacterium]|nr:GxxExxY protein [Gemmatimonadota bacterium]